MIQLDLDEDVPSQERKYEFKKRMNYQAHLQGLSRREAFEDLATFPVCLQVLWKPADQFTYREIDHIQKHIVAPIVEQVEVHCIHRVHDLIFCCRCRSFVSGAYVMKIISLPRTNA
jgi:hypothetical protein